MAAWVSLHDILWKRHIDPGNSRIMVTAETCSNPAIVPMFESVEHWKSTSSHSIRLWQSVESGIEHRLLSRAKPDRCVMILNVWDLAEDRFSRNKRRHLDRNTKPNNKCGRFVLSTLFYSCYSKQAAVPDTCWARRWWVPSDDDRPLQSGASYAAAFVILIQLFDINCFHSSLIRIYAWPAFCIALRRSLSSAIESYNNVSVILNSSMWNIPWHLCPLADWPKVSRYQWWTRCFLLWQKSCQ